MRRSLSLRTLLMIWAACLLLTACASVAPPPVVSPEALPSATLPPPRVTREPAGSPRAEGVAPEPSPTVGNPAGIPDSELVVTAADLTDLTLTFWHVWQWETGEALQALVESFNRESPYGFRVTAENVGGFGDLSSGVYNTLRGDPKPHLVVGFPNQLQGWDQDTGLVVDLNPYVEDPRWGLTLEEETDFYQNLWTRDLVGERRLGVPAPQSLQGLFYNETWARDLGFQDPPASPEEFREQACAAAQANRGDAVEANDGTGGWVIDTGTETVISWFSAFGDRVLVEGEYRFSGPGAMDALAFMKDLFDDGCAWLSRNRYPNDEFAARRALFIASSTTGLPFQEEAMAEAGNADEWRMIPFPAEDGAGVVTLSGPSLAILKSSPEEQLASWLFLRWLLEPAQQARWIRASGQLPSRAGAAGGLAGYQAEHPQWGQAAALVANGQPEPVLNSWGSVRWAVSDAAEQVFRLGLNIEQIPALLEELDRTAEELRARSR